MSLILFVLMLAKLAAVGSYIIDLKRMNLPCQTTQCRSMKICYSYDRFCNTGLLPRYCLVGLYTNIADINTETAMRGESSFYEFKKELALGDSPKVVSVILNDQGEDVVYCEDLQSRNESGSAMFVHLESMANSSIDIELTSDCDEHCTGVACNRCYYHPPVVTISVRQPVIIDENATIVCRILPLTRDTQIFWLMSNGTFSRTLHTSDKYQVTTNMTINSSLLTIFLVQHEDELNYTCKAINFMQTGISKQVNFNATYVSTENITSTDQNVTTTESNINSKLTYSTYSTKNSSTMKIDNTRITPSNKLFSTNQQKTSSTIPIRKLTTLKLSLTSKYITISSSVKGASTSTSRISPTTKSTTSLTNVNSVNTTITKYSIIHSSLTKPGRNTSSAVSSKGVSATVIPTVKTKSTTDPALSPITKTSAAPLCDKASSLTFEAIRSKEETHFQKLVIIATSAIVGLEFVIIALLICLVRRQKRWRLKKKTDEADTKF
ncbi:Hypothetical predicted protein [Mytilus galloprovincialis]|uniref:Ig-like domain-containing protein n=1 Tax=Mytilus galloprovincialis TaxID=29158 RepID=A0A8B6EGF2_MYTGA|nr:Hypothetical predicted protein [Mytilus galloprovincialis]